MSLHAPSLWLGGLFIYYCSLFVGTAFEDWIGASTVYTIAFTNNTSGAISFTVSVSWCKQVCVQIDVETRDCYITDDVMTTLHAVVTLHSLVTLQVLTYQVFSYKIPK